MFRHAFLLLFISWPCAVYTAQYPMDKYGYDTNWLKVPRSLPTPEIPSSFNYDRTTPPMDPTFQQNKATPAAPSSEESATDKTPTSEESSAPAYQFHYKSEDEMRTEVCDGNGVVKGTICIRNKKDGTHKVVKYEAETGKQLPKPEDAPTGENNVQSMTNQNVAVPPMNSAPMLQYPQNSFNPAMMASIQPMSNGYQMNGMPQKPSGSLGMDQNEQGMSNQMKQNSINNLPPTLSQLLNAEQYKAQMNEQEAALRQRLNLALGSGAEENKYLFNIPRSNNPYNNQMGFNAPADMMAARQPESSGTNMFGMADSESARRYQGQSGVNGLVNLQGLLGNGQMIPDYSNLNQQILSQSVKKNDLQSFFGNGGSTANISPIPLLLLSNAGPTIAAPAKVELPEVSSSAASNVEDEKLSKDKDEQNIISLLAKRIAQAVSSQATDEAVIESVKEPDNQITS